MSDCSQTFMMTTRNYDYNDVLPYFVIGACKLYTNVTAFLRSLIQSGAIEMYDYYNSLISKDNCQLHNNCDNYDYDRDQNDNNGDRDHDENDGCVAVVSTAAAAAVDGICCCCCC